MFIHGFEGPWLNHPFWRTRFLLECPTDLELLQASDISTVFIDDSRSILLEQAQVSPSDTIPRARAPSRDAAASLESRKADRNLVSLTIARSKHVVEGIFDGASHGQPINVIEAIPIVGEIAECVERNPAMFVDVLRLKSRDEYTYLHSVSVCALMINLARQIGLDEEAVRAMGLAGLLHDVGKMTVSLAVLNKPGRLDAEEFALIKAHPERGHEMLRDREGIIPEVLEVALLHHEKLDGTGYPFGLKADAISLPARMGAICDVYDALTSDRAYKERWTPLVAITEMHRWSGHFDPALLFDFCRSIGVMPSGMLVRMRSNLLGITLPADPTQTRTKVRVFLSAATGRPVALEDVFPALNGEGDQIVCAEDPKSWGFPDWDAASEKLSQGRSVRPRL